MEIIRHFAVLEWIFLATSLSISSDLIPDSLKSLKISLINEYLHSKVIYCASHTCIAIIFTLYEYMYDKSLNFKVYLINYTIKDMMRKIYMASLQKALLIFICLLPV